MLRVDWEGFNKPRPNWRKKPSRNWNQQRNRASLVVPAKKSRVCPVIRRSAIRKRNDGGAQNGTLPDLLANTTSSILIHASCVTTGGSVLCKATTLRSQW